ncbi:MAG: aspartate aminotransferase family protein [Candidatus Bathyarchaeota archaeon]|nr:aspartate aminotransferase family protein [Candidatus Bathyarchaeota archaeon]MCX8176753.1 aspartate aminotransferase family protein [Candidatus Bathyarchaeota archaeon]
METEDKFMANVYAKRPVVITHGKGAVVWDVNGKEYIDCGGSYGTCVVGHCHPKVVEAIKRQAERLISCHGSLYNDVRAKLLEKIVSIAPKGLNKVFLSNSGAEAVECAIKLARKFTGKTEIIAMMGAFHGKTMGALSATWDRKYRDPFKPLVPDFKHVPPDNLEKIKEALTDRTAAVIVEPIRGEGGIRVPPEGFMEGLDEICKEKGILLILDEVQTGFGRTGKIFACEHWNISPDILCAAKSVAGGLPIGLTIARDYIMECLKIGEHSTTYGGNPLVCAAACAAIDVLLDEGLPGRAAVLGKYFKERLQELQSKHRLIREVRGLGLMLGVEFKFEVLSIIMKALDRGVIVLDAGKNVLRFLPPLVIEKDQIDQVISVLDSILKEEESDRLSSTPSYKNA